MADSKPISGILFIIFFLLLLFAIPPFGLFAYIMRDGLGPDSVESTSTEAFIRTFWTLYWGPLAIIVFFLTVGFGWRAFRYYYKK